MKLTFGEAALEWMQQTKRIGGTMTAEQEILRALIITALQKGQLQPTELLDQLAAEYPEPALKSILLRLLNDGIIELTPNRRLQVAQAV
jgi:hypothetical protein